MPTTVCWETQYLSVMVFLFYSLSDSLDPPTLLLDVYFGYHILQSFHKSIATSIHWSPIFWVRQLLFDNINSRLFPLLGYSLYCVGFFSFLNFLRRIWHLKENKRHWASCICWKMEHNSCSFWLLWPYLDETWGPGPLSCWTGQRPCPPVTLFSALQSLVYLSSSLGCGRRLWAGVVIIFTLYPFFGE